MAREAEIVAASLRGAGGVGAEARSGMEEERAAVVMVAVEMGAAATVVEEMEEETVAVARVVEETEAAARVVVSSALRSK